jgi:hypothetical protein
MDRLNADGGKDQEKTAGEKSHFLAGASVCGTTINHRLLSFLAPCFAAARDAEPSCLWSVNPSGENADVTRTRAVSFPDLGNL